MTRGTWQGSGTWQTSGGPDLRGLIPVAVVVGVVYAVAEIVLELIWYIAAFLAAVIVGVVVGAVLLRRRTRAHAAVLEASRPARLAAATARPQVTATPPPAIVNNYGPQIHVYGHAGQDAAALLIRKALTGQVGDASTERKN
jgi:hypothetical protein